MPPDPDTNAGLPPDPIGSVREWAAWLHESYEALVESGFDEDQALELVGQLVANQGPG